MDAATLFENTMDWLRQGGTRSFREEEDIKHATKVRMEQGIVAADLPYRVVREKRISGKNADLAILGLDGSVLVAVEFKYEPSHDRSSEFSAGKFDVVDWTGKYSVHDDVQRVQEYAAQGNAKTAYAVFIDEGGHFCRRDPHPGSAWWDWGNGVWALWTKVSGDSSA